MGLTWPSQPYLWQAGAEFLTNNYTKPGFNNAAGRKALGFLTGLIQRDKVTQAGQWGAFDKGQAGMRIDGSWMVGIYRGQAPFSWGTAMLPIPKGGKRATNMGGEQIFVFKTTPSKQAAAAQFALWLSSTPVPKWETLTSFMPVRKTVAGNKVFKAYSRRSRGRSRSSSSSSTRTSISDPQYPDVSDAFSKAIEPAFYGRLRWSRRSQTGEGCPRGVALEEVVEERRTGRPTDGNIGRPVAQSTFHSEIPCGGLCTSSARP